MRLVFDINRSKDLAILLDESDYTTVATVASPPEPHSGFEANMRRLVASWNACAGIKIEELEQHGECEALDAMRAAVAKIEGGAA